MLKRQNSYNPKQLSGNITVIKIKTLEDKLPEPKPVVLSGKIEELKYSKLKVKIETGEGIVDGFLSEDLSSEEIASFWGKNVTITDS